MKYGIILLALFIFFGFGCNQSSVTELAAVKEKLAVLEKENQTLKVENEALKQHNDELQFGASRLLSNAKKAFDNKDYTAAISILDTLKQKHPLSDEWKDGDKLLQAANNKLAEIAEQKRQEEEKAKKEKEVKSAKALSKMEKDHDEVENIDWYYAKKILSRYGNYAPLYLYIGIQKYKKPWIRMVLKYRSDTWLFVDNCKINIDGINYTLSTEKFERDNNTSGVREWSDVSPSDQDIAIIRRIIASKKTIIRFLGDKGVEDRILDKDEKQALADALDAFEFLVSNN
jgi:flagellar biosynthesis GTPase FlhF